jgi:hypothetical protein
MEGMKPLRRKLTAREKLMRDKYTRSVTWTKGSHTVFLQIDHQGFGLQECENKNKAEWLRDMLAIALARIEL